MDNLAISQLQYQNRIAQGYRTNDLREMKNPDVKRMISILKTITRNRKNLSVLEIGCGTGRYFHALKNTKYLDAVDLSQNMLKMARNPINKKLITIKTIKYIKKDYRLFNTSNKYELIYSFGVLGEHIPFDQITSNKIFKDLSPNGLFICSLINPFGNLLLFISQFGKALLRSLKIFNSYSRLHLTGYGVNIPLIFTYQLRKSGFKKIKIDTSLKHYPHYIVYAYKK